MIMVQLLILLQIILILIRLRLKKKRTGETEDNGTKYFELMVPLTNISNFWRTLEKLLINCEINLDLNWSENVL